MHNISRVDSVSAHGWLVRVKRQDTNVSKFFSDSLYGGPEASKRAAGKFRDNHLPVVTTLHASAW